MGDPFFPLPDIPIGVEDLYRLNAPGPVRILLTIAADNLSLNDLDLLLLDGSGNIIDVSEGLFATEVLETPGAGDFLVGIRAFRGESAYILSFSSLGILSASAPEMIPAGADFVPGEVLVKFSMGKSSVRQHTAKLAADYGLAAKRSFPSGVALLQIASPKQRLSPGGMNGKLSLPQSEDNALQALTIDTVRRLREEPAIEYAELNFLRQPSRIPNDPLFEFQWHYELINLPAAWDTTIGSDAIIVAVIDTGVLVDHPDLRARLIDGFDFITDPANANDGDGMDPDPSDPGDDPRGASSSFHGTHVTGTVGAGTDNMDGVAGVTWGTRIMPLRVLGVQGGTDADIAQAIRYAAGLDNSSGTLPTERAHIINMSLGGAGFSQTLQDAILAARAQGGVVVAAAGNENTSALQSPAGLDGVIAVAAVDINAAKAFYSNFGPRIDVAAPGGSTAVDLNDDTFVDGVLSTLGTDQGLFVFRLYQGTSMASPHVAGVIALMLAVNPALSPIDIDRLLEGTHPGTTVRITQDFGEPGRDNFFGHGLIDAAAAITAAGILAGSIPPPPTGSSLTVSSQTLNFENFLRSLSFEVINSGTDTLTITEIAVDVPWLTVTPTSGEAPLTVTATVDRTALAEGFHSAMLSITSDAMLGRPTVTVGVDVQVGGETLGDVGSVFVLVLDGDTFETIEQTETDASQHYAYMLPPLAPGTYLILASTDRDGTGVICESEDACGIFPDEVTVVAGQEISGIDFIVSDLISPQRLPSAFRDLRGVLFNRLE
jgi:serine protease